MKRVLVIEDDEGIRNLIKIILSNKECEVDTCDDYYSAISKVSLFDYDLILVDYCLPRRDGIEVMRKLKELTKSPMLLMSNYTIDRMQSDHPNEDFSEVLNKYNISEELKEKIHV